MSAGVVRCRQLSTGRVAMGEGLAVSDYDYGTLAVSQPRQWVVEVRLNRPEKRNAMNQAFWRSVCVCVSYCPSYVIVYKSDAKYTCTTYLLVHK